MGKRIWFEVRVREFLPPDKWIKKSKFYQERSPDEAARKYTGNGHIMSVQTVKREQLLGIGEFFTLGPRLMRELRGSGPVRDNVSMEESVLQQIEEADKNEKGVYYGRNIRKAAN